MVTRVTRWDTIHASTASFKMKIAKTIYYEKQNTWSKIFVALSLPYSIVYVETYKKLFFSLNPWPIFTANFPLAQISYSFNIVFNNNIYATSVH